MNIIKSLFLFIGVIFLLVIAAGALGSAYEQTTNPDAAAAYREYAECYDYEYSHGRPADCEPLYARYEHLLTSTK